MEQFSVHRNLNTATADWAPYLCILQHDTLDLLDTRVVAPLIRREAFGRPASVLNPLFAVDGQSVVLSTAELAGVAKSALGDYVTTLSEQREEIIAALDLLLRGSEATKPLQHPPPLAHTPSPRFILFSPIMHERRKTPTRIPV